jgi:tetratricopeptide (TPR) repeat protein
MGGMGVVVAADDSELGRQVAIKPVPSEDAQASKRLVREARAMARLPLARDAAEVAERTGWTPLLARALILRGECEDRQRQYAAAQATFDRAAKAAAQAQDDAAVIEALALRCLVLGEHLGRPGEALEGRQYIEILLERAGSPPRLRALWLHYLAIMLHANGRQDEALEAVVKAVAIGREIYPDGHVRLVDSIETQGNIEIARGEMDHAEALLREVLAARSAARGPDHMSVSDAYVNLGVLEGTRGRFEEAIAHWERSLAISRAAGSTDCSSVYNIGYTRLALGQWGEAARRFEEALACVERLRAGESTWAGTSATFLGVTLALLGDLDRAGELVERGVKALRGAGSPMVTTALSFAARLALLRGDRAAARRLLDEAKKPEHEPDSVEALAEAELLHVEAGCRTARPAYERAVRAARNEPPVPTVEATTGLATCLIELGSPRDAVAALEPELAHLDRTGADIGAAAAPRFAMARALVASGGDRRRARTLAEFAQDGFATLGAPGKRRAAEVARWLARHR